jgi:DNA topoisomerase-1
VSPQILRERLGKADERAALLYDLIYKRFLASQMANAVFDEVHVNVVVGAAIFSAKGSQLAFDGFLRVYGYDEEKEVVRRADEEEEDDTITNKQLPRLQAGESVQTLKLTPQQHFTKPLAAYTEALLIKALEQHGVGRPSTYSQTVATIKKRGYVANQNRKLAATELGREVHQVLATKLPGLFELSFTAQMETSLDEIAVGKQNGQDYLQAFWSQVSPLFGEQVITATVEKTQTSTPARKRAGTRKQSALKAPVTTEYGVCPQCGKALLKRKGSRGEFLGCSGFPKCRFTKNLS